MRNLVLAITTMFILNVVVAQQKTELNLPKRNTLYFEVFGQGLYNSFAFDRLYKIDKKIKTSFTAGLTIIPSNELFVLALPLSYNFIFGKNNHHLELGFGITPMLLRSTYNAETSFTDISGTSYNEKFIGHSTNYYLYPTPKIGYRFQKANGGFFFRITLTPPIAGINKEGTIKGGSTNYSHNNNKVEYFKSAAIYDGYKIFPWAGISFGYTLMK